MADATQAPTPALRTPPPTAAEGSQLNHLAGLHRMSRTAGLGSSEYSEVNVAAVAAVVIGAMSALSLMTPIFLILPVAGLIVAIIAIRQIGRSGGTQTGMLLAIVGLLACVGFSGFTGFEKIHSERVAAADRQTLDAMVVDLGNKIGAKQFDDARKLGDPRWQDYVSSKQLDQFFGELTAAFGPIKDFHATGLYDIQEDPETGMRMAVGMMRVDAEKTGMPGARPVQTEIRFRNSDGEWKIYAIPEWFKPPGGANGPAGGPPGPAAPGGSPTGPAGPPA